MFNTNPETEIEVERLSHILAELPIRAVASYEELSQAVGYSVQEKPFALIKARERVETQTGLRFSTVRGEGVKKLDGSSVVGIGAEARKSIARRAKQQAKRLSGLKYNDIDAPTQARIDAERSLLGAISSTARTKVEKVVEHTSTGPIVAAKIFDLMNRI